MNIIPVKLEELEKPIILELGFAGENMCTGFSFACDTVFSEYPDAIPSMAVTPPKGSKYPVIVTRDGNNVLWNITDSDTAYMGSGEVQLIFTQNNVVKRSYTCRTRILKSILAEGTPPDPVQSWIDSANEMLAEIPETIDAAIDIAIAAAKASGEFKGDPGFSPVVTTAPIAGGNSVTITDEQGEHSFNVLNGANGVSPDLSVTPFTGGHRITIVDASGTNTFDVTNGVDATPDLITVDYANLTFPVAKGATCYHNGQMFEAKVAIQTAEEWDSSKWDPRTVEEQISSVLSGINGIVDKKASIISNSKSGTLVYFTDGADNILIDHITIKKIVYSQSGSGTPSPQNIMPITGKTGIELYHGATSSNMNTKSVNFPMTVYRATNYDVAQGIMMVDMVGVDLGNLNWTKQTASSKDYFYVPLSALEYYPLYGTADVDDPYKSACSIFKKVHQSDESWGTNSYLFTRSAGTLPANVIAVNAVKNEYADAAAFKAAMSGQILCYQVVPFELNVETVDIKTLLGSNVLMSNENTTLYVEYKADTKGYSDNKVNQLSKNVQHIDFVINKYNPEETEIGIIREEDGTINRNTSYVTTGFIQAPIKYNKNINYIHAFHSTGYATYIALYRADKSFINRYNASEFTPRTFDYAYVRVTFHSTSEKRAVIFTNESILPQYEKQKKYLQYDNDLNSFNKFVNSDGAISAMIRTGLMYLGDEQFGYGTEHTLFATSCVKSTKDTHTESSNYTGERYQLDCSAYTQIMLMGITPECSRYFSNKNTPSPNGYRFNKYVQYEGYVYNVLQEGNTKRLYANAIAEYAYKNGYLFLIDDGFTNIRPGDILFWSNQPSSYHFFEDIGHAGVVVDVVPMEDGSNTVVTFEGKGGSGSPCQFQSYTSRASTMVYAARFPMPYVHDDAVDIASFSSAVTTAISGSADSVVDIATVQTETLEAGKMYTVLIKCDLPENCYVQIKTNGMSYLGVSNDDVLKRPDGYYVFHIFSKKSDTLTETGSITIQAHCTGTVSDNAVLSKMRVYEGFVTPMFG